MQFALYALHIALGEPTKKISAEGCMASWPPAEYTTDYHQQYHISIWFFSCTQLQLTNLLLSAIDFVQW